MREFTNLAWPETPFGADKRPFPKRVFLAASTAVQWADDGDRAVPMAAGMVYLPVHRTKTQLLDPARFHFGYRAFVLTHETDAPAIAEAIDGHLVQARRHAAAVAAHDYLDDAAGLLRWTSTHTAGIASVAAAWEDRANPERSTAALIETARDLTPHEPKLTQACEAHGLKITEGYGGLPIPFDAQAAYDTLIDTDDPPTDDERETIVQSLAHGAVYQALAVALLAAYAIERAMWDVPLPVGALMDAVTWDVFPRVRLAPQPAAASQQ